MDFNIVKKPIVLRGQKKKTSRKRRSEEESGRRVVQMVRRLREDGGCEVDDVGDQCPDEEISEDHTGRAVLQPCDLATTSAASNSCSSSMEAFTTVQVLKAGDCSIHFSFFCCVN